MNHKIYFISGLGADHRLFARQINEGIPLVIIPWKVPLKDETIESYAKRMTEEIPHSPEGVIIGGVSFGGVMAIEMSKFIDAKKVIIISSLKTSEELPLGIKFWRHLPLYKLINGKFISQFVKLARYAFGKMDDEETQTFFDMARDANPDFVKWASGQIIHWKNKDYPPNTVHIHGTDDRIFPITHVKEPVIKIPNGTHIMIATSYIEVNQALWKAIKG